MTPRPADSSTTTDLAILRALRAHPQGHVSGAELAQQLGITRAAIWNRIRELRLHGYDISASPQLGYRLESAPDLLLRDDLLAQLGGTRVVGRDIQVFQQTASTNDIVEKLARDGVREGAVVLAESQTRGRGRLGRKWVSPPGRGLWCSVLLRPRLAPSQATRLTILAAVALARAIRDTTGLEPEIKWPNDLLLRGRKVAGILTEMHAEVEQVRHVILGIGVNVNLEATDLPPELRSVATSLKLELGVAVDRAALLVALLHHLDEGYARLGQGHFDELAAEWADRCGTLGRNVCIRTGSREIRGCAESLDDAGALLVRTEHGHLERIIGGEVTLTR
ncbi:MAG: biotin--[acetyl-CoA-carboxylase] ligase [Verrucomicrobiae bacterium]|nr:biotin--[acetyl-CoA-carboxylase] ligase [Verrucomicrobiae bacterium]MCP5524645.1 biotin--[acetyl-CoA-carboxylase] ligase [Verrucomicrobiales bacterium]